MDILVVCDGILSVMVRRGMVGKLETLDVLRIWISLRHKVNREPPQTRHTRGKTEGLFGGGIYIQRFKPIVLKPWMLYTD